ncbi:nuclear transport factor 2 family protein [Neorhizobium sp. BETTINA12A]|uniref:nuclear transport factor 2 family protein n=1 Tax=Neorhizobium sp. BETTINA12A TaxID=2908924 RepID=UPI001FF45322|nr:nuclear transport factor 2 family protein [Neorhizobium sp. BETTINA12A]MCJ9751063.1 nuclear transport factor 2 family protein [Neorhizobium sp. BETTINA12A]
MKKSSESADRIRELLDRNLQEVFGENNDERRRAAIGELWAEDGVLYVPPGVIVGREAIDKFAGDLRKKQPHFAYTPRGAPQVLHDAGRLAWGSGPRGEAPAYTGCDVITVRDGRITALYVFLDENSEELRWSGGQIAS